MTLFIKKQLSREEEMSLLFKKIVKLEKKLEKRLIKLMPLRTEYEEHVKTYLHINSYLAKKRQPAK